MAIEKVEPEVIPEYVMIRKDVLHTLSFILMFNRYQKQAHKNLCLSQIPTIGFLLHAMSCKDTERHSEEEADLSQERLGEIAKVFEDVDCKAEREKVFIELRDGIRKNIAVFRDVGIRLAPSLTCVKCQNKMNISHDALERLLEGSTEQCGMCQKNFRLEDIDFKQERIR